MDIYANLIGWERKYMWPFVSICIVDKSLCYSMTLMIVCVMLHVFLDIDNLVSVFYLFLFSILKRFGHG